MGTSLMTTQHLRLQTSDLGLLLLTPDSGRDKGAGSLTNRYIIRAPLKHHLHITDLSGSTWRAVQDKGLHEISMLF